MIRVSDSNRLIGRMERRVTALSYHIRNYYWLDFTHQQHLSLQNRRILPHGCQQIQRDSEVNSRLGFDFMPLRGGYFIGNVSPAHMDFRWFLIGNCIAILSSLATLAQATAIMDLVEERWEDLIGEIPLKSAYPALEGYQ
ncbi:hypothetical protein LXL04_013562 [Taraxacum kok-saghyz]